MRQREGRGEGERVRCEGQGGRGEGYRVRDIGGGME